MENLGPTPDPVNQNPAKENWSLYFLISGLLGKFKITGLGRGLLSNTVLPIWQSKSFNYLLILTILASVLPDLALLLFEFQFPALSFFRRISLLLATGYPHPTPIWFRRFSLASLILPISKVTMTTSHLRPSTWLHMRSTEWLTQGPSAPAGKGGPVNLICDENSTWLSILWNQGFWKCRSWSHCTLAIDFFPIDRPRSGDKVILQIEEKSVL